MREKMKMALGLATVAAVAAPLTGADAGHEVCHVTREIVIGTGAAGSPTIYYEDRSEQDPVPGVVVGPGGTWLYLESNNKTGLQHKKDQVSIIDETDYEICTRPAGYTGVPDTLIF